MIKTLTYIAVLLFSVIDAVQAADHTCKTEIAIASSGNGIGSILEPLQDENYSVWFPIVPRAIAVDSKDNIYVGDSVNYRVLKFKKNGQLINTFKLQPPARKQRPKISHIIKDIGIDNNDKVYVWNYFEKRIEIYIDNGIFFGFSKVEHLGEMDIFKRVPRGQFGQYKYDITSYIPDKRLPGKILYSITVKNDNKIKGKCRNVDIAADEDGLIYQFDNQGNILTFDYYKTLNVIRIKPFE